LYKEVGYNGKNNKVEGQKIIKYDKISNTKSVTYFNKEKETRKEIFKYNKNMRLIDEKIFIDGNKLALHKFYLYEGDKLMEITYDENEVMFYKQVFTHDNKGNIIGCTYYDKNNIPKRKYELQIEYY
jgi:hypothetical protein